MLSLRMHRAPLDREAVERFPALKDRLRKDLKPVLSPALSAIAGVLAVSASDLRAAPSQLRTEFWEYTGAITAQDGEILTDGASLIIVALHADRRLVQTVRGVAYLEESEGSTTRRLAITYIGPTWDCAALAMSLDIVKEVMGLTPEPAIYSSQRFDELKAEGRESPTPPSVEEEAAVSLLSDRLLRTLALAIKTSGGLLVRDLPKQLPEARDRAVQIADRLKAGGLVDSEIVIVCGKTQAQVARAPSRDVIADLATRAVKCACGRSLAEERTEEALAITDLGRALLDKARWLTILLVRELERMGVPRHSILVEQTVGGDEIDCLANISGDLALFELKDKDFNLGNAYSFGAKIAIIRPKHSVILTTERVGNDAKEHFLRARLSGAQRRPGASDPRDDRGEISYIEGVDALRTGLEKLVSAIYRRDAITLLDQVLPLASVNGRSLLGAVEQTPAFGGGQGIDAS